MGQMENQQKNDSYNLSHPQQWSKESGSDFRAQAIPRNKEIIVIKESLPQEKYQNPKCMNQVNNRAAK